MTMRECYEAIGGRCPGTPSQRSNDSKIYIKVPSRPELSTVKTGKTRATEKREYNVWKILY